MHRQTLIIPVDLVRRVRSSAYHLLGLAGQAVGVAGETEGNERHPEWFLGHLEALDRMRALLDAIGWMAAVAPVAVQVDLERHGGTVLETLRSEADEDADALKDIEEGRLTDPVKVTEVRERVLALAEYTAIVERELRDGAGLDGLMATIVVMLLDDERGPWWTRGEVEAELKVEPGRVGRALADLEGAGVVVRDDGGRLRASDAVVRLGVLELISI